MSAFGSSDLARQISPGLSKCAGLRVAPGRMGETGDSPREVLKGLEAVDNVDC